MSSIAHSREDFIKRLFAVTLSVGIANQISHIVFGTQSTSGNWNVVLLSWHQLLLLAISLAIIVSSWEGYLSAIQNLPLEDAGRFYVDIAIVFTYLFLTLSVQYVDLWFYIHVVIFFEYLIWDILRERSSVYKAKNANATPMSWPKLSKSITLVWLVYFVAILELKVFFREFDTPLAFLLISGSTLFGVIRYRDDKKNKYRWKNKLWSTLTPVAILSMIALLSGLNWFPSAGCSP